MEVHFTPEQEARLAQIATNAEQLVKNAALRLLEEAATSPYSTLPSPRPLT